MGFAIAQAGVDVALMLLIFFLAGSFASKYSARVRGKDAKHDARNALQVCVCVLLLLVVVVVVCVWGGVSQAKSERNIARGQEKSVLDH